MSVTTSIPFRIEGEPQLSLAEFSSRSLRYIVQLIIPDENFSQRFCWSLFSSCPQPRTGEKWTYGATHILCRKQHTHGCDEIVPARSVWIRNTRSDDSRQ